MGFLTVIPERTIYGAGAAPVHVASPNGEIKVEIRTDTAGQLAWSVKHRGQPVLAAAPLGLTVDGNNLGQSATLGTPRRQRRRIGNKNYESMSR